MGMVSGWEWSRGCGRIWLTARRRVECRDNMEGRKWVVDVRQSFLASLGQNEGNQNLNPKIKPSANQPVVGVLGAGDGEHAVDAEMRSWPVLDLLGST